jgi:tripartite-type tricarboxylate transporter receptor subunit TctC
LSKKLSEMWGQPVVVDNRPGAQGNIGTAMGVRAQADGYTITLILHSAMTVNPHIYKDVGFDPQKDFIPVARVTEAPYLLIARGGLQATTMKELAALSKAKPEGLTYASVAAGPQAAGELFKMTSGANMLHIPYQGSAAAMNALLAGDVDVMIATPGVLPQFVKNGKLRAIAVIGKNRTDVLPDTLTALEQGFPALGEISEWYAFAVPVGTPQAVVNALNAALTTAIKDPSVEKTVRAGGFLPSPSTQQELQQLIHTDFERWKKVVKASNIKAE